MPWSIAPLYRKACDVRRRCFIVLMLRTYFLQQWGQLNVAAVAGLERLQCLLGIAEQLPAGGLDDALKQRLATWLRP